MIRLQLQGQKSSDWRQLTLFHYLKYIILCYHQSSTELEHRSKFKQMYYFEDCRLQTHTKMQNPGTVGIGKKYQLEVIFKSHMYVTGYPIQENNNKLLFWHNNNNFRRKLFFDTKCNFHVRIVALEMHLTYWNEQTFLIRVEHGLGKE